MTTEGTTARPGIGPVMRIKVELWVALLFVALAFGAGVVVRSLAEPPEAPAPAVVPAGPAFGFPPAPPLTEEQLQQGLPPGHPDVGGVGGSAPAASPSASPGPS